MMTNTRKHDLDIEKNKTNEEEEVNGRHARFVLKYILCWVTAVLQKRRVSLFSSKWKFLYADHGCLKF